MKNVTRPEEHISDQKVGLLARNALHLGIAQVVSTVLAIVMAAVIARSLGAKDFGLYYIITTIQVFALVLIDWGQYNYVIRETARGRSDDSELVSSAILFRIIAVGLISLVAAGIALISGWDDIVTVLAPLAVLVMFPGNISQPIGYLFRGRDRMDLDALVQVSGRVLVLAASMLVLKLGGGLTAVVLAQGISGFGVLLAHFYFARKIAFKFVPPAVQTLRELLISGAPLAAFALTLAVQPFIDVLILSFLTEPHVVGWFGAARTMIGTIIAPAAILAMASFPELSRASQSIPELRSLLISTARPLLALSACACSALYIFADHIVTIVYGQGDFGNTAQILRTASPVLPLLFMDFLLGSAVTAIGKTMELAAVKIFNVAIAAGIAWFAIGICQEHFGNGAIGLMIAFGLAEILMMVLLVMLLPRASVSPKMLLDLFRAYLVAGVTVLPLSVLAPLPLWLDGPCFAAVFTAVAFTTGLLRREDLKRGIDAFRKRAA